MKENEVRIGRSSLSVVKRTHPMQRQALFVHTGHSARLLEQLTTCLQMKESALLIGETGTGKTAMVQHIASHVGAKLIVLNLSQQTDSSDLLGGFKPISPKDVLLPLVHRLLDLMKRTWTKGNNEAFVARVLKYAERSHWKNLERAFKVAIDKARSTRSDAEVETVTSSHRAKRQKQDVTSELRYFISAA